MPSTKLGTLTIGQAPRADITPILERYLPDHWPRQHAGVLDGLSREEIAAKFAPQSTEILITRLLDGSSVRLDKAATQTALQCKIDMLEAGGCTTILLLCTGEFHGLTTRRAWLLEPERLIAPAAAALARERQVGIIVPLAEQVQSEAGKWASLARSPIYGVASPYAADHTALQQAAEDLRQRGAELLLLDCMGFVEAHRKVAIHASGLPTILSNALVAKLVSELAS